MSVIYVNMHDNVINEIMSKHPRLERIFRNVILGYKNHVEKSAKIADNKT